MTICDVYGTRKEACQRKGMIYIFISAFCVAAAGLKYATLPLFTVVLSSDNSILCFCRKAFLKSDMLAGFTTSVDLIEYLTCDLMKVRFLYHFI